MEATSTLERWPVKVEIPVAWGEMDAFGHVNNTVYLRWFETARIAYFERTDVLERMKGTQVGPIVARIAVDYRRPVTYPDTITVWATVASIGNTSLLMKCRAHSARQQAVCAEGETVIVIVDYRSGAKVPVDGWLREEIHRLEETASE